jgi:ubiquitin-protein ligase
MGIQLETNRPATPKTTKACTCHTPNFLRHTGNICLDVLGSSNIMYPNPNDCVVSLIVLISYKYLFL